MRPALTLLPVLALGCAGSTTGDPASACGDAERDTYAAGFSRDTDQGGFAVTLVDATPAPPDEGENLWTVRVEDGTGPVPGANVVLEPWMPDHNHGLNPSTYTGALTDDGGETDLDAFELIMPGLWEFRFLISSGMQNETVTFRFCAEG